MTNSGSSDQPYSEFSEDEKPDLDPEELKQVLQAELTEDIVQRYLQRIAEKPLFTAEQELQTAQRAKAGDFTARQAMIEHNLRLVVSIAKNYMNRGLPLVNI